MKEVEIFSGILLIVTGAMLFEIDLGAFSKFAGLLLLGVGVFFYMFAVDTLEETKNKRKKKKNEENPLDYL
jgi:hypothetical protein